MVKCFYMKKWILVFLIALGLNLIWENLHSVLYVHYQGGPITELILLRAALVDALIILGLILIVRLIPWLVKYDWLIILLGIIVSLIIEYWAIGSGRWLYKEIMPIIPLLKTGLTPTIQLGLLGYLSYRLVFKYGIVISNGETN